MGSNTFPSPTVAAGASGGSSAIGSGQFLQARGSSLIVMDDKTEWL